MLTLLAGLAPVLWCYYRACRAVDARPPSVGVVPRYHRWPASGRGLQET